MENPKYKATVYLYQRRSRQDTWGRMDPPAGLDYRPTAVWSTCCACDKCARHHSLRVLFQEKPEFGKLLRAEVQFLVPEATPTPVFHLMEGDRITGQVVMED